MASIPSNEVAIDNHEENEDSQDVDEKNQVSTEFLQNPQFLAAMQDKLNSMIGHSSGYIQNLPPQVKRRIKSLKKLQNEVIQLESKFCEEVYQLECKYAKLYRGHFAKRADIVAGRIEPTDEDCDWPSDEEAEDDSMIKNELVNETDKKLKIAGAGDQEKDKPEADVSGVPEFWFTVFKNVDMLSDMMQEHDFPIMQHLEDLRVVFNDSVSEPGFTLEFYFSPNDWFTNDVLTKQYFMRIEPDEDSPLAFEGPEIVRCKGCTIDWKPNKNVTVKLIKKTQKHKGSGTKRTVTKTVQTDSFFNFFNPPALPQDSEEVEEELENLLATDYEIGHFIRERIIPRAVLYYTGEAIEDMDEQEEEGDEEDEMGEGGGEDDDDHDPDYKPPANSKQECKQQ